MRSASLRFSWEALPRLPESSPELVVMPLANDERYEDVKELGLVRGELAAMRSLPGRVFFGVDLRGAPVAVGAFDAAFPGASPFRVTDPSHAKALLASMRRLATHDFVHVFVEGDDALESALLAAGATATLRTLRMEGSVPAPR
jgi:hypothetical protein